MVSIEVRAILAALERILYLLLSLVGLGQALGIKLDKTATESTPYRIQGQVDWIGQQLTGQPWSLPVLHNQLTAIIATLDGINAPVLDAIAALPAGSAFPPIPSDADNAQAVWQYVVPLMSGEHTGTLLEYAGIFGFHAGDIMMMRPSTSPYFLYHSNAWDPRQYHGDHGYPTGDWTDLLPADTRLTWLTRTEPSKVWHEEAIDGTVWCYYNEASPYAEQVFFALTEMEFQGQKATRLAVAPIWPGLANVTLGDPVALGSDVTIPGPLDGVLIALTTPPSGLSSFSMGGQTWYYRAGQVAFVSDNGDTETWQYITWTNALYCPRAMVRAASAILRGLAGVEGTVTPWLTV